MSTKRRTADSTMRAQDKHGPSQEYIRCDVVFNSNVLTCASDKDLWQKAFTNLLDWAFLLSVAPGRLRLDSRPQPSALSCQVFSQNASTHMPPILQPHKRAAYAWDMDLSVARAEFLRKHPEHAGDAAAIEIEYRRFLFIKLYHADEHGSLFAAPPQLVLYWRSHVADAASYSRLQEATGISFKFDPALCHYSHPTFPRRFENTMARYEALIGTNPRNVRRAVWGGSRPNGCGAAEEVPCNPKLGDGALYDPHANGTEQDKDQVWLCLVRTLTGQTLRYHLRRDVSIQEFKHLIHRGEGIPCRQQRLLFAGKQLEGHRLLKGGYGATNGAVLHLVLRLTGC